MNHHPDSAILEGFLLGRLSAGEFKKVVIHLMMGCDHCHEAMEPLAAALLGDGEDGRMLLPEEDAAYETAISSAMAVVVAEAERIRPMPGFTLALSSCASTPRSAPC